MNERLFLDRRAQAVPISQKEYLIFLMRGLFLSLLNDLEKFLDKEGRYYGIMVTNIRKIRQAIKSLEIPEEEFMDHTELENRIIYLYKPIVVQEHKKFLRKRVSKADSIICICKKVLDISSPLMVDVDFSDKDITSVELVQSIIDHFYDNIKNKNKEYSCSLLTDILSSCIDESLIGSYESGGFSIVREEERRKKKSLLEGSGIRIDSSDVKIAEVSWTEE